MSKKDCSVQSPHTSQTFIAIVCSPAFATTKADPLMKLGVAKFIKVGGSTAVVVVVSPSASVTGTENATVWSILNI